MVFESISSYSIPVSIYLVMGIIVTRIHLNNFDAHGYRLLQWLQFAVDVLRIVFLWPLVLFIEKMQSWLEISTPVEEANPVNELVASTGTKAIK